jgi:hypothetical protein
MTRDVPAILDEWRRLERELDESTEPARRVVLQERIEAVRTEHLAAIQERDVEAHQLGGTPRERRSGDLDLDP